MIENINRGLFVDDPSAENIYEAFGKVNGNNNEFNDRTNNNALDVTNIKNAYITASAQWSVSNVNFDVNNNDTLNLFSLITDDDKVAGGNSTQMPLSAQNGIIIPYVGTAHEGYRLQHRIRVNFELTTGSRQDANIALRRTIDDSIIGQPIGFSRNTDFGGVLRTFVTYTASATDSFVTGGFYIDIINNSGATLTLINSVGILVQTTFEKLVIE